MSSSLHLLEWHRRRRQSASDLRSPPVDGGNPPLPGASPPQVEASPLDARALPLSPLLRPSPADLVREDLVRRNARQVRSEYAFDACLGEGSFGKVHAATHRRTGVRRAVKEIPRAGTETAEFEWELQALVALDHPHVVKVIEYFDDAESYYLVMELLSGPDLFTHIVEASQAREGGGLLPEREVSVILRQCLKAVLCCHANGFVHRDLNAKNFMFTGSDCTLKLIDFGLAARFHGLSQDRLAEVVGTSHYMAPEMMLDGQYSPAADLWSLGVLFYVLLTGLMLLPKDDARKRACLRKGRHVQHRLQHCQVLQQRAVSEPARDLLGRMLQNEPSLRISAKEALAHPFVWRHSHDYLGPPFDFRFEFDRDLVAKLRRFAKAPRLKKVALLTMAHLADHERDLLAARHMFRTMDADGDGRLSAPELEAGLLASGVPGPPDLAEVFAACDSQRSGTLGFEDFMACLLPARLVDERLCHEAFNVLDPEGKGRLGALDLQAACPSYDLQRCEGMVGQADPGGKGFFDFEDFHRFLCGADEAMPEPPHKQARRSGTSSNCT